MKIKLKILLISSLIFLTSLSADFIRDDNQAVVLDTTTRLMWQDNGSVSYTWQSAINFCENLTLAGYSDWRLPNINELRTIIDDSRYNPSIYQEFVNNSTGYCWSSTTEASNSSLGWYVGFYTGFISRDYKTNSNSVRCVRGGQ
jgi:hypothetical protein